MLGFVLFIYSHGCLNISFDVRCSSYLARECKPEKINVLVPQQLNQSSHNLFPIVSVIFSSCCVWGVKLTIRIMTSQEELFHSIKLNFFQL